MNEKYFVNDDPKKLAAELIARATDHFTKLNNNGYFDKVEQSWLAYHGMFYDQFTESHKLITTGDQGELLNLPVNHYRNIADNMITMITNNRPQMQTRAINTDAKSLIQAKLGNGILDFYMREKRLERHLTTAVKYAVVEGSGFIKMDWDVLAGPVVDYEDDGSPIFSGDITFKTIEPVNVFFDNTKDNYTDHDWVLCRTFKNRFDVAAKYPEFRDEILKQETKSTILAYKIESGFYGDTDDIPIYEFYHKSTPSVPEGKYMLFVGSDVVLQTSEMPYRTLPVYRVTSGDILGTPLAYSPLFDILPIQDAINILYSAIVTNNNTFGVQNVISPRGANVEFTHLSDGMNFIEYNAQAGGKPEALQLTASSPETYRLIEILERKMETLSGVNAVARGNPEKHVTSGTALAMIHSMALQYISGLQQSYIQLIEDCGSGIINMLKDFASEPRVASIVGKMNEIQLKKFSGDDLSNVERVVVDVGNPMAATHAGKMQIADQLLQYQLLDTPDQYLTILKTGNLDVAIDNKTRETIYIQDENERMLGGEEVSVVVTDDHLRHINEHKFLLSDVDLKKDADLVKRVAAHIQAHITELREADPQLLAAMGQKPMPPPGAPGAQPNDPNAQVNNSAGEDAVPEMMDPSLAMGDLPEASGIAEPNQPRLPNPPPVNDPRQV